MKQRIFTLTFLFTLFCSIGSQAQDVLIQGSRLDIGSENEFGPFYSGAIGTQNSAVGGHSLAIGYNNTITQYGYNSVAFGSVNNVSGSSSMAVGSDVTVLGSYSMGIGRHLKVSNGYNMVVGNGITDSGDGPNVLLENPYNHSLMVGFLSSKPTLTVGPSPNTLGEVIDRTGKVAIGDVPVPDIAAKLHIRSDEGEDAGIFVEPKDSSSNTFIRLRDEDHRIEVDNNGDMSITAGDNTMDLQSTNITLTGKVGVNIANESDTYALAVNGGILTNEVFIKKVEEWYDNVFAKDYKLLSLNDLKRYINEHGHLPEVPSETEVKAEGYNMAEMQSILLKKIEELTLYTLQQQELIERLEQRIEELEKSDTK